MNIKAIFKFISISLTVVITITYLTSCLTSYISPEKFSVLTILSIGYLVILPVYILVAILWLFIKRKVGILLLLLVFAGSKNFFSTAAFNFSAPAALKIKDSNSIRIMSWNVNEFVSDQTIADTPGNARRKMFAFIKEIQPDILCIQDLAQNEGSDGYLSNIAEVLKTGYYKAYNFPYYAKNTIGTYTQKYGVAVFSKFPLKNSGSVSITGNPERTPFIDIDYLGNPLRIFSAHFLSMSLWPSDEETAGVNYFRGDSTEVRMQSIYSKIKSFGVKHAAEARIIKQAINETRSAVVFCGDLNSVPSSFAYQHLKKGMKDAFLEKGKMLGGTYNRVFPKIRIDVLLHSKQLKTVQYYRPLLNYSDHCPIIADIQWKE